MGLIGQGLERTSHANPRVRVGLTVLVVGRSDNDVNAETSHPKMIFSGY